jgi:secreted PhoX family phosphatase
MNDEVKEVMAQAMSRKQFLQVAGMGLLSVFGISNFLSYVLKNQSNKQVATTQARTSNGFGARTFGN